MSELLTEEQVRDLTDYERPAEQSAWLSENRILHYISRKNKVKVTWWAVNHPMSLKSEEPDFGKVS